MISNRHVGLFGPFPCQLGNFLCDDVCFEFGSTSDLLEVRIRFLGPEDADRLQTCNTHIYTATYTSRHSSFMHLLRNTISSGKCRPLELLLSDVSVSTRLLFSTGLRN